MTAFGIGDKVVVSDRGRTVTGRISEILEGEFTGLRLEGHGYDIFNAQHATRYVGPLFKIGDTVVLSHYGLYQGGDWGKYFPAKVATVELAVHRYLYGLSTFAPTAVHFNEVYLSPARQEQEVEASLADRISASYWELIDACKKTGNVETWRKTLRYMLDLLGDA